MAACPVSYPMAFSAFFILSCGFNSATIALLNWVADSLALFPLVVRNAISAPRSSNPIPSEFASPVTCGKALAKSSIVPTPIPTVRVSTSDAKLACFAENP
jgi:hypothetical protein